MGCPGSDPAAGDQSQGRPRPDLGSATAGASLQLQGLPVWGCRELGVCVRQTRCRWPAQPGGGCALGPVWQPSGGKAPWEGVWHPGANTRGELEGEDGAGAPCAERLQGRLRASGAWSAALQMDQLPAQGAFSEISLNSLSHLGKQAF